MKIEEPTDKTKIEFKNSNLMEANKAAVRRLYEECINGGKWEIADELIAAEFVTPGPDGGVGADGFKANVARLRAGFPDLHFTIHDLLAENDQVALHWIWQGTHRGTFAGIPATGKSVRHQGMVMYRFKDGKAVAAKLIFDRLGVFEQLGSMPALPASSEARKPAKS